MTPITEEYLLAHGWYVRERARGIVFYLCEWNPFQTMKMSYDQLRKTWRLHWNYNDTNIAAVEDINTMAEIWGRSAGLKPRTTDPLDI